jgi:beta-glucanase (GH16 family)
MMSKDFYPAKLKNQISMILFSLVFLLNSVYGFGQWKEVWVDHFNESKLSAGNWIPETGNGSNGWGNREWQYYTADTSNLKISNGKLFITARKENREGFSYTSARIKTQKLRSWTYGRVEARIRIPRGQGLWPAFWMLGERISDRGWPECGEIDVMEHINLSDRIHGTIHWDSLGRKYQGGTTEFSRPDDFHLYAVEWSPEKITWFFNETAYHTEVIGKNMTSRTEFHQPFFLLLNLAVGGDWPGDPDSKTRFPATMEVDYVRILQHQ